MGREESWIPNSTAPGSEDAVFRDLYRRATAIGDGTLRPAVAGSVPSLDGRYPEQIGHCRQVNASLWPVSCPGQSRSSLVPELANRP
jgi:hypothetical protein